ncbi:hypothetical protein FQN55_001326 [Onygenales sp. PD_40]|nr:hypothetical protein FQN55_001326 [Onygenales sp. PD_40]KAK2781348.1 hypothetical protein FQN53_000626 [Emmonsiellopsis sp. PD_33]
MRQLKSASTALAVLSILLLQSPLTHASPFPPIINVDLAARQNCDGQLCGFYKQLCCSAGQTCSTSASGQAVCADSVNLPQARQGSGEGQWEPFTTVFVQTDLVTVTSTGSRWVASPTSNSNAQCKISLGESACGTICCTAAQACKNGQCVQSGASPFESSTGPSPTAPLRPTSSGGPTVTTTPSATVPFLFPVGTDGSALTPIPATGGGGGLSGGAIAGIVIGTLAGVVLLFILCLSACAKSVIAGILGLLGLGKKKKKRGSNSTHSFSDGAPPPGRTWFGGRPPRPPQSDSYYSEKTEKSGLFGMGKWASIGLIFGALAICLGLRNKKKSQASSYAYSDSYYTYDYSSTESSK